MSSNNIGLSRTAAMRQAERATPPSYVHGTKDDSTGVGKAGEPFVESSRSRAVRTLVGRNDPCPCGSLLKFKKCHGKPKSKLTMAGKKRPTMVFSESTISLAEIDDEVM